MVTSPGLARVAAGAGPAHAASALDALREAVVVVDTRQMRLPVVLVNAVARRHFGEGVGSDGPTGRPLLELLGRRSQASLDATLSALYASGDRLSPVISWRLAGGETALTTDFSLLESEPGQRLVMLSFATELAELAEREEIFRLAADAVDGVIFEWDVARGVVLRSCGVREVLGLERHELAPDIDAWRERIHRGDLTATREKIDLALVSGRGWVTTYRIRDARGRYRSMLERALIQRDSDGKPVRAISCAVDVSEINRLTDLLAETERAAKTGGWEYFYRTQDLTWTDEMFRIFETTPDEFAPSSKSALERCTPQSRRRFRAASKQVERIGGQVDLELELTTFKDQRIWVRIVANFETLEGQPFRAFGSLQNIQSQKLAQMALERSTSWLRLSMDMANMHAWRWDRSSDAFEFAAMAERGGRLTGALRSMKKLLARAHPEDRHAVRRAMDKALEHHREVHEEFRLKSNQGQYRSYATIARPLFDPAMIACGLVGVTQDVTARRDSELRLRRSEELLRVTTANTADTLVLLDTDLRIRFVNKNLHGMTIAEMLGREVDLLVPEETREAVLQNLRHILQSGETATYEFERLGEDQQVQYFENRAVPVRDGGVATGISLAVRDITERKRLEREILEVSSRERQSIGRDLHDGLGQELTGVALMLRGLATKLQNRAPEAVEPLNEIVGLVNQSIESARALARGLLPVSTERGGLAFALRTLAARSHDLYGLDVRFRPKIWPELTFDETQASHLYRIAQEALTNAARHGHATSIEIVLKATQSTFSLSITDNGSGIGPTEVPATGMGMKIMAYRASMIGAKLEVFAHSPHGTVVRVAGAQPAPKS